MRISQGILHWWTSRILRMVMVPFSMASKPKFSRVVFRTLGSISSSARFRYWLRALPSSRSIFR